MLSKGVMLIIISMMVFGILNLIENLIHYSIGRSYGYGNFVFSFPTYRDFLKIIIVMLVFGFAQEIITEYFMKDKIFICNNSLLVLRIFFYGIQKKNYKCKNVFLELGYKNYTNNI